MADSFQDALQPARKMEMDGIDFYSNLAEQCASEAGKAMFTSLADDEKRHLRIIKEIAEGMGVSAGDLPMPRESIRTIFADAAARTDDYAKATQDEKDAIQVAMGMETKSFQLYTDSAGQADDNSMKRTLRAPGRPGEPALRDAPEHARIPEQQRGVVPLERRRAADGRHEFTQRVSTAGGGEGDGRRSARPKRYVYRTSLDLGRRRPRHAARRGTAPDRGGPAAGVQGPGRRLEPGAPAGRLPGELHPPDASSISRSAAASRWSATRARPRARWS